MKKDKKIGKDTPEDPEAVGAYQEYDTPEDSLEEGDWDEKYDIWKDGYECGYGNCVKWGEQLIKNAKKEGYEEGLKTHIYSVDAGQNAYIRTQTAKEIVDKIKAAKTVLSEKREDGVVMQIVDAAIDGDALIAQIEKDFIDGEKNS